MCSLKEDKVGKALALLSGGLDSAIALALHFETAGPGSVPLALTFDYGQKAREKEKRAAQALCSHYGLTQKIIPLPWLSDLSNNALTGRLDLPFPQSSELDQMELAEKRAKDVWVPNRNGVFIQIGAAFAEGLDLDEVLVGFNIEEAASFPDNSKTYMDSLNKSLLMSTQNGVKVISPSVSMDKKSLVAEGLRLDLPFSYLWSCYQDKEEMCGLCESCLRLKRAWGDRPNRPFQFLASPPGEKR
jgi:7-cyano-7-deazaguanine synthase